MKRRAALALLPLVLALHGFEAGEPDAEVLDPVLGRDLGVKAPEKAAVR